MPKPTEQRRYIRLDHVYPVQFAFVEPSTNRIISKWKQGFTSNVSKGGICLNLQQIDKETIAYLKLKKRDLALKISMPLYRPPMEAKVHVTWIKEVEGAVPSKYMMGCEFTAINDKDRQRIIRHARKVKFSTRIAGISAVIFLLALSLSLFHNVRLHRENTVLIENLVKTQQEEIQSVDTLNDIAQEKIHLSGNLAQNAQLIEGLQQKLEKAKAQQAAALENQIAELKQQREPMVNRYAALLKREGIITDKLSILERTKKGLQKKMVTKMVQWLKNHQNPSTGLVKSFEGQVDVIENWSFIYDQALAANVFLIFDDIKSTKKILNFFARTIHDDFNGFTNAYYVDSGKVAEYTVHCGPNIWVGMAILQYTHKTKDKEYLPIAEKIADWLLSIQDQDREGGLRGGPKLFWFATEHNLDAYAFFKTLYAMTGKEKYKIAQQKTLSWLRIHAMAQHGEDYKQPPIKRGRGDSTIATDTFAWSLAAIGPDTLTELNMHPEEIMRYAEDHCGVNVRFKRPSGAVVEVKGFDFSKPAHVARGGIVSPEWTSQMIVSYQILGEFFLRQKKAIKADYYKEKVKFYLNELNKLIISSPSPKGQGEGCLPYATTQDADTGHGWRTPNGASTGSIAGTAYMIMAIKEYNPLQLGG